MRNVRQAVLMIVVVLVVILATTATAFAGTLTVNLHAKYNFWNQYGSHRNDNVATCKFTSAPNGNYRVRVDWAAGNGANATQQNQYFYTWWLLPDKTIDFTSP